MRAREDARAALARGTIQILIDPADPRHLSLHPDDAMYYYRDAWQLAALALGLLVLGGFARVRRA